MSASRLSPGACHTGLFFVWRQTGKTETPSLLEGVKASDGVSVKVSTWSKLQADKLVDILFFGGNIEVIVSPRLFFLVHAL